MTCVTKTGFNTEKNSWQEFLRSTVGSLLKRFMEVVYELPDDWQDQGA
jgi:hypothetical protein